MPYDIVSSRKIENTTSIPLDVIFVYCLAGLIRIGTGEDRKGDRI